MNVQKRKVVRISIDLAAYIEIVHQKLECRLINISELGAAIHLSKAAPLMVGNQIHLIFSIAADLPTHLKGKVVYIAPDTEDMEMNRIGIEFCEVSERDKESLETWIKGAKSSSSI